MAGKVRPGGISRRDFLKYGGASIVSFTALGGLLAACSSEGATSTSGAAGGGGELIYAGFGGTYEQAVVTAHLTPFTQATGIKTTAVTGGSDVARIKTMVEAGRTEWDVSDATGPVYAQLKAAGLVEPMDMSVITVKPEDFVDIPGLDAIETFGIVQYAYSRCIFWNTELIDGRLETWADVFDTQRFPGTRAFQDKPYYLYEIAMLADGADLDEIYPIDIDRVIRKLESIKSDIVFQDLNQIQNLVGQGEIVAGDLNLARVKALINDGVPLEYHWNQAIVDYEHFVVLKGAPNKENAMKFIDFTLQPENQMKMLELLGYTPTLKSAQEQIQPDQRSDLAGTGETLATSVVLNPDWYAENWDEANAELADWLLTLS